MPPRSKRVRKSFSACWTCRRRHVHCDGALPACTPCRKHCVQCEGYGVKLVWVDRKTGKYPPSSRRSLATALTWRGWPVLGDEELERLIAGEHNNAGLQQTHPLDKNPFNVFDARNSDASLENIRCEGSANFQEMMNAAVSPSEGPFRALSGSTVLSDCKSSQTFSEETSVHEMHHQIVHDNVERAPLANLSLSAVDDLSPGLSHREGPITISGNELELHQPNSALIANVTRAPSADQTPQILFYCPTITTTNSEDAVIFFHYMSWVAPLMVPVDSYQNPWKTIYPSTALQDTSPASRALYHALLAKAAFNLANLYGENDENCLKRTSQGLEHYGASMRRLRQCFSSPVEDDFDACMATLYTLAVLGAQARRFLPWRSHFTGAQSLVNHFIREQPWKLSSRSWTISQSLALTFEVAHTSNIAIQEPSSLNNTLFEDVSSHDQFGFTVGASGQSLRILSRIRLLIQQISSGGSPPDIGERLQKCIDELTSAALEADSDVDCIDLEANWESHSRKVQSDALMQLHERMFRNGIMIYLYRNVLNVSPQGVVKYVSAVLHDALTFIRLQGVSITLWPVFISAVEAYETHDQRIVDQCLDSFRRSGIGNRETIRQVIHAVWNARIQKATKRGIELGQTRVDWRKVQQRLGCDVLLL